MSIAALRRNLGFGTPLTGFLVSQRISPVTIDSLTATSVTFSYEDVAIPQGVYFQAEFETGMSSVPLPASAPMLGAAILALGYAAMRKKAATTA